jgi:MFS superfamily sulfate permease-like transporter
MAATPRMRLDRHELAGAVADVGVLVPIAAALIVSNGLSATAVLLPAGMLYVAASLLYRLPVPVQPLKAFGAIAIAKGLGADEIAAGALLMGAIFVVLGRAGLIDRAAKAFPRALVRGVQLSVGLLFLKIAWGLVHDPPKAFSEHPLDPAAAVPLGLAFLVVALVFRRHLIALILVAAGLAVALGQSWGDLAAGPSAIDLPSLSWGVLGTALTVLVLPQLPLSFANSCVATADAARTYFGEAAERVRAGRLAQSLGVANLVSGAIAGMPVCHGAGGMTAHRSFGARTGGAPLFLGVVLLTLALGLGAGLATLFAAFPLPILGAMLAAAGVMHLGLLRDLSGAREWGLALLVGGLGVTVNLAVGLGVGLVLWWAPALLRRAQPA